MLKKTMILALAAMAVLAVSVPAASASWYKHHSVIQTDQQIQFTGQAKFESLVLGNIECQTQAKVKFLAGQTTANIEEFALDAGSTPTARCNVTGAIANCDTTAVSSNATTQAPWVAHLLGGNKDTIEITTGTIQNLLEGATPHSACNVVQQIQIKPGIVHATVVGSTCTISQITLSGQLEAQTGAKLKITGTQSVIPGATYGTLCP